MSALRAAAPRASVYTLADAGARTTYAEILTVSPQRSPFSDLPFADAACRAFGLTGYVALVGDGDAGLVLFEKRRGGLRAAALPPYAQFVTPVLRAAQDLAAVHERRSPLDALARVLADRTHQATLLPHPSLADLRPLAWAGWSLAPTAHMSAPVRGADGQGAWSRSARKTVRQSQDRYDILEGAEWARPVVALAAQSMAAKGLGHPAVDAVAQVVATLVSAGQARVAVAVPVGGGAPEAGLVLPVDGPTAYYLVVGSVPGPAMTVLMAHVAASLVAGGQTSLYLGGANIPSVAEFKRSLGGELLTAFRARHVRGRLLRLRDALASV